MLHEVRIYNGSGKLKKTIKPKELSERHWAQTLTDNEISGELRLSNARNKIRQEHSRIYGTKTKIRKPEKTVKNWAKKCFICSDIFYPDDRRIKACSDRCRKKYKALKNKQWKDKYRKKKGKK